MIKTLTAKLEAIDFEKLTIRDILIALIEGLKNRDKHGIYPNMNLYFAGLDRVPEGEKAVCVGCAATMCLAEMAHLEPDDLNTPSSNGALSEYVDGYGGRIDKIEIAVDHLRTKNSKMLLKHFGSKDYNLLRAEALFLLSTDFRYMIDCLFDDEGHLLPDDEIRYETAKSYLAFNLPQYRYTQNKDAEESNSENDS